MGESRNVYVEPDERAVIRTADVYQTEVEAGTGGYSDTLLAVVANFRNSGAPEGLSLIHIFYARHIIAHRDMKTDVNRLKAQPARVEAREAKYEYTQILRND